MSNSRDYAAILNRYVRDILSGKILACKWAKLAAQRHQRDIAQAERGEFDYVFDAEQCNAACRFMELLPYPTEFFQKPPSDTITLEPFQIFIIGSLFGWVWRSDTTRYRFREAYITMARKNAKSTLAAGIGIKKYCAEHERGAQVFFGARSREQALEIGLTPALAMIENTPDLQETFGIKINKKSVVKPGDRPAIMRALIGKPGDGASPHCAILDEFHEALNDVQYQAMKLGMGARRNPLLLIITTAGYNLAGPCRLAQDTAEQILEGTIEDDRRFVLIYTLDEDDDYRNIRVAIKANPNLGISVDPEYIRSQIKSAQNSASEEPGVKTKNFNLWVNDKSPWIRNEDWKACADLSLRIEDFVGDRCIVGFDLADSVDLAAKMRMFLRLIEDEQHFYLFGRYYLNEVRINEKRNVHYQTWVKQGHLVETPGNTTSYITIKNELVDDCKRFLVKEVPHDPHHARPLVQFIQAEKDWDQSVEFVEILPTYANFSWAMKELEKAVLERRIHHNGDPVLAWSIGNTICKSVGRDNVVPDKKRPELKIDPTIATLNCFIRAATAPAAEEKKTMPYTGIVIV